MVFETCSAEVDAVKAWSSLERLHERSVGGESFNSSVDCYQPNRPQMCLGWRPSLVGWTPSLVGWRPSLLFRLEAIALRLEAIPIGLEAIAIRLEAIAII